MNLLFWFENQLFYRMFRNICSTRLGKHKLQARNYGNQKSVYGTCFM